MRYVQGIQPNLPARTCLKPLRCAKSGICGNVKTVHLIKYHIVPCLLFTRVVFCRSANLVNTYSG